MHVHKSRWTEGVPFPYASLSTFQAVERCTDVYRCVQNHCTWSTKMYKHVQAKGTKKGWLHNVHVPTSARSCLKPHKADPSPFSSCRMRIFSSSEVFGSWFARFPHHVGNPIWPPRHHHLYGCMGLVSIYFNHPHGRFMALHLPWRLPQYSIILGVRWRCTHSCCLAWDMCTGRA